MYMGEKEHAYSDNEAAAKGQVLPGGLSVYGGAGL